MHRNDDRATGPLPGDRRDASQHTSVSTAGRPMDLGHPRDTGRTGHAPGRPLRMHVSYDTNTEHGFPVGGAQRTHSPHFRPQASSPESLSSRRCLLISAIIGLSRAAAIATLARLFEHTQPSHSGSVDEGRPRRGWRARTARGSSPARLGASSCRSGGGGCWLLARPDVAEGRAGPLVASPLSERVGCDVGRRCHSKNGWAVRCFDAALVRSVFAVAPNPN